jgi:PLP dependent protein
MKTRFDTIEARIQKATDACGRDPNTVKLVAVSKTKPADLVREAIDAGVRILGENYIQEARDKITVLSDEKVLWHFIGHLQRNKAKVAVGLFDLIHSVDSLRLAREIDKQAQGMAKIQKILIQVNVASETSKSGVSPADVPGLIREIAPLPNISIRGLMTMPPFFNDPERVRPYFLDLARLKGDIQALQISRVSMDELSMGMTGDFETAIECGATLVRIGTALFGKRE